MIKKEYVTTKSKTIMLIPLNKFTDKALDTGKRRGKG